MQTQLRFVANARLLMRWLPVLGVLAAGTAYADCGQGSSDEVVKACLAQDLRDSDKRINVVYKLLQESSDTAGKLELRNEQRAWLRSRDRACKLNNQQTDREKWLESILASQKQTVCVVRYTFSRVAELDQALQQKAPRQAVEGPSAPHAPHFDDAAGLGGSRVAPPPNAVFADDGYTARTIFTHERGKWYYEVWIDQGGIAKAGDALLTPGYESTKSGVVRMVSIRRSQADMPPLVIGLALDLDDGFVYVHRDGTWKFAPGAAGAVVMPMTGPYWGSVVGSTDVRELIARNLVRINTGDRPFSYPAPAGYKAWGEH